MCLSLCACGSDSKIGKEDMLAAAEVVTSSQITQDTKSNIAKAKQLYCGKVHEVTGMVATIKENYVEIGVDTTASDATSTVKGKLFLDSIDDTDFVIRDAIIVE